MGERSSFRGTPRQVFGLIRKSVLEWLADKAPKSGAALAYYALFALGPLLLIAVGLAGLVVGHEAASQAVAGEVGRLVGPEGQEGIEALMQAGARPHESLWSTVVGAVLLLVAAAGLFAQLRSSLNQIWEVEEKTVSGWKKKAAYAVRNNLLSFAAVAGAGFLLLVSLLVSAFLSAFLSGPGIAWQLLHGVVAVAVAWALFALMYRFLPNAKVAWRDVAVGAFFTAVLFLAGQQLIGLYLAKAATASRYGAAGAVLVVLLWVYYSGLVLLLGAEMTQVYANTYGSRIKPSERGEPLQEAVRKRHLPPDQEGTERTPGKKGRGKGKRVVGGS